MPQNQLARAALFGTVPGRTSVTGADGKGLRRGRCTSQAMQLMQKTPGIDQRIWANQALNKEKWVMFYKSYMMFLIIN